MKSPLAIILALCLPHGAMAEKLLFGDAPKDEAAKALCARIVETYRAQGVAPAIRLLESEGRTFIKGAGATARHDFFDQLAIESDGGEGRKDDAWKLALTEWCYFHCRTEGDSYWLSWWTPKMHERYFEAGSYGQARAVIDFERCRMLESGKELDIDKLETTGPRDPEFPAIGKKSLGARERIATKERSFFIAQAEQDLAEGKWRRGMEAASLSSDKARGGCDWYMERPNLTDSKAMVKDLTHAWRKSLAVNSAGFRFLGLLELELRELEKLSSFGVPEPYGRHIVTMGKSRALWIKYLLGNEMPAVKAKLAANCEELKQDIQATKDDPDRVRLMIADICFGEGETAQGWKIIGGIQARQDMSRDMRFEVDSEWCRHRVAQGLSDGVEPMLIGLLKIAREGGLKQREIGLYETYAKLLVNLGRYGDALVIQQEQLRLLRAFGVFPRIPEALRQLAVIQALMGQRNMAQSTLADALETLGKAKLPDGAKARLGKGFSDKLPEPAAGNEPAAANTDLQPQRVLMVPLKGFPARGYFTLANLSGKHVDGTLNFRGPGLTIGDSQGIDVKLRARDPGGKPALALPVSIPAGDILTIDIFQASSGVAEATEVSLEWKPGNGDGQTATWKSDPAEEGVSLAITDAGEYLNNPFYMIPVHHLLQYQDAFAQVADFRVVASAPARIEFYDSDDELVFVDANGDGKFESEGDIISKDLNRNGWGDITLKEAAKEMRFRLFVHPKDPKAVEGLSLDLQLFQQGQWVTHSTDRLLFPGAAE